MDYATISNNINNKVYDSKVEYPKFSRKANPEEWNGAIRAYRLSDQEGEERFRKDCRAYIETEIGKQIADKQFNATFSKAWEDGHSGGYEDVLIYLSNLIEIVKVFIDK